MEFNIHSIVFLIFSVITLGGGLGTVTSRNLIHGAVYLIVSLFGVAGLFILLSAPFLAAIQVLVYIGAIAILIIFAVMLTRSMTRMTEIYNRQWSLSLVVSALLFVLLLVGIILPVWGPGTANAALQPSELVATTVDLGVAFVDGNQFVLPFEVASLLLTAAMIGAIVIARDRD
ncbi:MAG: NADH-quinone oxidoreductase subunit J [Chloroflexota bacterium]|nr:MAG: NADH-quinone oxidoreductase subunit J [Chloroflexota bacterium]